MIWQDVVDVFFSEQPISQKYRYFYDTLHRVCIKKTLKLPAEYNDFFSRLQATCRLTNYPLYAVDNFRWRARQVMHEDMECDEHTWLVDTRVFVDALSHFTDTPIPAVLKGKLPDSTAFVSPSIRQGYAVRKKRIRFTVKCIEEPYIYAYSQEMPSDTPFRIDVSASHHTQHAAQLLKEGMQFNALSFTVDNDGVYHPQYIVVEPDYLLDTTSVTGCIKAWGESAFNHLLAKFKPSESTIYTLMGDFANQFLDDALNMPVANYQMSMRKVFVDRALDISACDEIDARFFEETQTQFANIQQVVKDLELQPSMQEGKASVHIEPSFFCEALGLQGRMDCLVDMFDGKKVLLELKSGKWDEFRGRAKDEHLMQMLLYKEILFYNTGQKQSEVIGSLLYSKYPKLQEQRSFQDIVLRAMTIRNNIVALELGLLQGEARKWLPKLTPQSLRRNPACSDKLWTVWCLPEIKSMLDVFHSMDSLTAEYFYTFLQFIEREQFASKMCDSRPDSTRALSSLWNADVNTKLENGDILLDLHVVDVRTDEGIAAICLESALDGGTPNFRIGDSVIMYRRNTERETAVTQQVIRCSVESFERNRIWLKLKNRQRNKDVFSVENLFAIEHDHVDANFRSLYSGLFSLLTCEKSRRELLLCQREPALGEMYLLVGPPGTGKTSVALKRMVEEELALGHDILLLSYTNRAVDEICEMLSSIHPCPDYIRLGRELSCAIIHRDHLFSNALGKLHSRQEVIKKVEETHVFVSTVASMNSHMALLKLKHFHMAIFDEASQILEPQVLGILTSPAIERFVMIGDHKQLPAVVVQDESKSAVTSPLLHSIGLTDCRNSLFERLYEKNRHRDDIVSTLHRQGRMHPAIADFASFSFYDDMLQPVGLPHQLENLQFALYDHSNPVETLVATRRCAFINVPRPSAEERMPKANMLEARMIAQLVKALVCVHRRNQLPFDFVRQLGIIVPFRRQIAIVRSEISKVLDDMPLDEDEKITAVSQLAIDTVERYQGSQRDIIIYGTTITQHYELEILSNLTTISSAVIDRKLNVAVTRARKQFFVLGNERLLRLNPIYESLIDYCTNVPSR